MNLFERVNQQQEVLSQIASPDIMQSIRQTTIPQFQVDLTPSEQAIVTQRMSLSDDPDEEKEKWQQAILMSRQYDVPLEYAIENLDSIVKYQTGRKPEFNQTFTRSLINSAKIGEVTATRAELAKQWYWAEKNGEDTTELERQIAEKDAEIAELYDYTPRNVLQQFLKGAAQTLAYSSIIAGASFAGNAIGNVVAPGVGTALSIGASFAAGYNLTKYSSYYDMVKSGVDPKAADWTSTLSGGIQAAIESILGIESGLGRIAAGGSANFITRMMKNMYLNGSFNAIGLGATRYLTNVMSEGIEEFLQEVTDNIFTNIAYTNSEMDAPYTINDIWRNSIESFVQGAGAALILGGVGTIAETVNDVRYAKSMRADALQTDSKQVFIENHMDDEQLETIGRNRRKEALSQTYENIHTQYDEAMEGLSTAEARTIDVDYIEQPENVGSEDEEGNIVEAQTSKELPELKRLDNGRLRVQENPNVVTMADGTERHQLLVGSNDNSSNRYGYVTYSLNEDGSIDINSVKTRAGYQNITSDIVQELARRNPGVEINWDPSTEAQQNVKQSLIDNSPTGKLNWYEPMTDQQEQAELAQKIGKAFTNLNRQERDVAAVLMQLRAQAKGMTANEYMDSYITDMEQANLERGKLGRTIINGAKAVIQAGQSSNFSTFAHETFHVIRNEMTDEENQKLANAFKEAVGTDSFKRFVAASRKVLQMDYSKIKSEIEAMDGKRWTENQEEIAARMFESYLLNGKTTNSKLADLFSKIAEFFRKIYGVLRGQKMLNDNIVKAYDSLFEKSAEAQTTSTDNDTERTLDQSAPQENETDLTEAFSLVKDGEITSEDVEKYINGLIGELYETSSDPLHIQITKYGSKHIVSTNVRLNESSKAKHDAALVQLDEIIENAMYSSTAPTDLSHNTSERTLRHKENVEEYVYFDSPIRIGEGEDAQHFNAELTTERVKNQDPNILDLYNVRVKKVESSERNSNVTSSPDSNDNIAQSGSSVKSYDQTDFSAYDSEYFDAIDNNDLEKAQNIVNEVARLKGYSAESAYQGTSAFNGMAPSSNGYYSTREEREQAYKNESFEGDSSLGDYKAGIDPMNLKLFLTNPNMARTDYAKESVANLKRGLDNGTIMMYRSVPNNIEENSFRNGDWVTPSRKYAVENADVHGWGEDYRIIEQEVPIDDIWWDGNDINEWGYDDGKGYAYQNTENNRKLLDVITRDEDGNIIPPSQRFNAENPSVFYQTQTEAQTQYDEVVAKYKGSDQWLKAPNGKDTNLTERQWVQVRTPNFIKWFGDWINDPEHASKVVDENGEPKAVYHGTPFYGFDAFDTTDWAWFSETSAFAEGYMNERYSSRMAEDVYGEYDDLQKGIYNVFLNIKNPIDLSDFDARDELSAKELASIMNKATNSNDFNEEMFSNGWGDESPLYEMWMNNPGFVEVASRNAVRDGREAYDGLFVREDSFGDDLTYSVWNPTRIKSATDNNGNFSSQKESIYYQTEDEDQMLMSDAKSMDREEFLDFGTWMYDDYSEAELNEIWNRAHGMNNDGQRREGPAITDDMTDDEKDEEFIRYFESDDALRGLINRLRDAYSLRRDVNHHGIGANSEEEYNEIVQDLERLDRFMREASPFFRNIVSGNGQISETSLKNIRTTMENAPRMYRDLYAEITGDENLRASVYDNYLPNIDEPGFDELRGMSIADRKRLSERIENETLKRKILSGEETLVGEAEKVVKSMDDEIAKLEEQLKQMQAKNNEYYNSFNEDEKSLVKLNEQLADAKHQLDEYNRKIRLKLDKSDRVNPKTITDRNTVQEKIDLLNEQLKTLRATDRTKAAEQRRQAIADLKQEIREKQNARREAKKVHDYKQKLASAIVRPVSDAVDYEYRQRIMAIQALVDPNFRQNTIWYEGKRYTLDEFRNYFRSMFDGVSDEELNEEIRRDYEAFGLTRKQAERLLQKNLNDFTVAELEQMAQQVADLADEGRQVWQAKQDEKRRQARRTQQQIIAGIMARPHAKTPDEMPTPGSAEDKKAQKNVRKQLRTAWFKTLNMDRKAQMLDNDEKGVAYDLLIRKRREVQANESKAKSARIDPVMKLMDELGVKPQDFYETVDITMNSKVEKFTYSDLFYGLAAQKEQDNYRAFVYGTLVTIGEKERLHGDNNLIEAYGDAKNRQFVQQAQAALAQKPDMVKVFEAMEDDLQNHSTAMAEFSIREYNTVPNFMDYYLPIYRADFNGTKLAAQMSEDVKRQNPGKNAALPSMGRWKERIDISANNQRPVHMDYFSTWLETVEEVEHTIATLGYERDLKRVFQNFGSENLKSYIDANFGRGMLKDIDNYINEVGNPPVYNDVQGTEKTIRTLRGNLYSAYLGFKASGIVLQAITSPAPTLGYVNPFNLARNLLRMTFQYRKTWDFVSGMSEFMKNRSMDPALDIVKREANTYTDPKLKRAYARFLEKGTMGLEVIDKWAVTASWMALYEKKLNEFEFQTDPESMRQAARYADEIIAETQPLADPAELAPLFKSRSEWAKAFMQFTTSMNVIWNNVTYDIIAQSRKKGTFKRNVGMLFGYALAGAILGAVQNGTGDEDKPEEQVRQFFYNMTTQFTGSVPVFGTMVDELAQGVITGEASKFYGTNSIFPGIEDTMKGLTNLAVAFNEEDEAKRKSKLETALKNMTKGVGLLAGVPTSALKELDRTFFDEDGFTFNPAALAGRRD